MGKTKVYYVSVLVVFLSAILIFALSQKWFKKKKSV